MTEWVTAKELAAIFKCHKKTVVTMATFGTYLFPRGIKRQRQWFWKMTDVLRWKYQRLAAWKKPVHGLR